MPHPKLKGIILAGGNGTRLSPMTNVINKHLLPVYDKPLIYYPLAVLMLGGLRDILLISSPEALPSFQSLFGDGSQLGLNLSYAEQSEPKGIPQALTIADSWLNDSPSSLILGDNILYGNLDLYREAITSNRGATLFTSPTKEPDRFGIVELDSQGKVISLEEKPAHPKSDLAIPGLYLYDSSAPQRAAALSPSARGEFEINDLHLSYLADGLLDAHPLGRGFVWLDAGTPDALLESSNFVHTVQQRSHYQIACLEEIAWRKKFITTEDLEKLTHSQSNLPKKSYLKSLLD